MILIDSRVNILPLKSLCTLNSHIFLKSMIYSAFILKFSLYYNYINSIIPLNAPVKRRNFKKILWYLRISLFKFLEIGSVKLKWVEFIPKKLRLRLELFGEDI